MKNAFFAVNNLQMLSISVIILPKKPRIREVTMKKLFQEFRAFIAKGNVVDMAIGVIVGGAFGKIVTSLVNDIIMPVISLAMGGKSMASLALVLNGEPLYLADGAANPAALVWHYGSFIQSIIDFLIIALCVFLIMKLVVTLQNSAKSAKGAIEKGVSELRGNDKNEAAETAADAAAEAVADDASAAAVEAPAAEIVAAEPAPTTQNDEIIALLTEIRNALKKED